MRKEDLHNALMHPENLSDEQLAELRDTVSRFPFFGAAQIALTRAFKARGDVAFTDQLSQAAIYTGHRAALYHRLKGIHRNSSTETIKEAETEIQTASLASQILEHEEKSTPVPSEPQVQPVTDMLMNAQPQREAEIPTPPHKAEVAVEPTLRLAELDTLEAQILVTAVNTTIELEVQPVHEEPEPQAAPPGSTDLEPDDENSYAALIFRRAQRQQAAQAESGLHDTPEISDDTDDALPAFRSTPLSHGIQRIRSTDSKQHQRDLVDRFIFTEPQIARGKAGEYPTGNLAKESLEEDFSMITETMAILFAKQGKMDKARKAYRKLMEQHPEKSIYFAAQLKNLDSFKK